MSDFKKFTSVEEKKWEHFEALQAAQKHSHLRALLHREKAKHFQKRLKHIESFEEFELIEEEMQNIFRFPFMSASAKHFEAYFSKKTQMEKLNQEIAKVKTELKL